MGISVVSKYSLGTFDEWKHRNVHGVEGNADLGSLL
jgi:hypothetical protein